MRIPSLLLALALTLAACAKGGPAAPPAASTEERKAQIAANSLTANAASLLKGDFRSPCDDKVEPLRQEIAAALDARRAEIEAFSSKQTVSGAYRVVPFGPTIARERIEPLTPSANWNSDTTTWLEIGDFYDAVKGTPIDAKWVELNKLFRGQIVDDVDRIVDGVNYEVTETSGPGLARLLHELEACDKDSSCTTPAFSAESKAFIATMSRLRAHLAALEGASEASVRRSWIHTFLLWVRLDYRRFDFVPNPLVRVTSPGHYVLPLDPGPFAGASGQLHRYVEEVWKGDGKSVTLELGPRDGAYRVELGNDPGGRSWVSRKDKVVSLDPYVRSRSIAHEIGHVLGFGDNYFSIFNPGNCSWTEHQLGTDVMSDSSSGSALPSHWDALAAHYK